MKVLLRSFSYFISALCLLLSGCDTVSDAVTSEPSKSVCTAYCEWAAACNSTARESDEMALFESCLATTQAQDPDCQVMESEGLNKVSHAINQSCVESIEEERMANRCDVFTGSDVEFNQGRPPLSCATNFSLFNTARASTAEQNDPMCTRVSVSLCTRTATCIAEQGVANDVLNRVYGDDPAATCAERLNVTTEACQMEERYELLTGDDATVLVGSLTGFEADESSSGGAEASEMSSLIAIGPSRAAAERCLAALDELPCDQLISGMLPPICAGAVVNPVDTALAVKDFVCELDRPEFEMLCDLVE